MFRNSATERGAGVRSEYLLFMLYRFLNVNLQIWHTVLFFVNWSELQRYIRCINRTKVFGFDSLLEHLKGENPVFALQCCLVDKSPTCYVTADANQARIQKCFAVSKMPPHWHALIIPQRTMRPSIALVNKQ